jgi:hypothetical protein
MNIGPSFTAHYEYRNSMPSSLRKPDRGSQHRRRQGGIPIALIHNLMVGTEFYFSLLLFGFTALLCLFGFGLLLDSILRFARDLWKESRPVEPAAGKIPEEKVTGAERAA